MTMTLEQFVQANRDNIDTAIDTAIDAMAPHNGTGEQGVYTDSERGRWVMVMSCLGYFPHWNWKWNH